MRTVGGSLFMFRGGLPAALFLFGFVFAATHPCGVAMDETHMVY
jgi:hypothetical protein